MLPLITRPWYVMSAPRVDNTYTRLILTNVALNLPVGIWLMSVFVRDIPVELEEAARVDGCTTPQMLWRIVFPLVLPGLAAMSILAFVFSWNEFAVALNLTAKQTATVPVAIAKFAQEYEIKHGVMAVGAVLSAIPRSSCRCRAAHRQGRPRGGEQPIASVTRRNMGKMADRATQHLGDAPSAVRGPWCLRSVLEFAILPPQLSATPCLQAELSTSRCYDPSSATALLLVSVLSGAAFAAPFQQFRAGWHRAVTRNDVPAGSTLINGWTAAAGNIDQGPACGWQASDGGNISISSAIAGGIGGIEQTFDTISARPMSSTLTSRNYAGGQRSATSGDHRRRHDEHAFDTTAAALPWLDHEVAKLHAIRRVRRSI
jgi:hypothetical protein